MGLIAGAIVLAAGSGYFAAFVVGSWNRTPEAPKAATKWMEEPPPPCEGGKPWRRWQYPRSSKQSLGLVEAGLPAIADLDADGLPDLAYPHQEGAKIRIFWGDHENGFSDDFTDVESGRLTVARYSTLGAGDVTGDGKLDLVGQQHEAGQVVVIPGRGGRVFGGSLRIPYGERMGALQVTDWDQDGIADVLLDGGELLAGLHWFRGGPSLGTSAPQGIADGAYDMSAPPTGGELLRLRELGAVAFGALERLHSDGSRVRASLQLPVARIDALEQGYVATATYAERVALVRMEDGREPCTISIQPPGRSVFARNGSTETIAQIHGSAYTTSTYVATWR
jgi:hypothetical protein